MTTRRAPLREAPPLPADWRAHRRDDARDGDDGGLVVFLVAYVAGIATGVMAFAAFVLGRVA